MSYCEKITNNSKTNTIHDYVDTSSDKRKNSEILIKQSDDESSNDNNSMLSLISFESENLDTDEVSLSVLNSNDGEATNTEINTNLSLVAVLHRNDQRNQEDDSNDEHNFASENIPIIIDNTRQNVFEIPVGQNHYTAADNATDDCFSRLFNNVRVDYLAVQGKCEVCNNLSNNIRK